MSRKYPLQYSKPVLKVLKAISIGKPNIVGSAVDYTSLYSVDYDLIEDVILKASSVRTFQKKIKGLHKVGHIVDIKIGEITEWNLLKKPFIKNGLVENYNQKEEQKHLSALWTQGIISNTEFMETKNLLKPALKADEFLLLKKELRFGLLRWTPKEVEQGYITLRTGKSFTLKEAFKTSGITKIDVVAFIQTKYIEFSNIILWTHSNNYYAYLPSVKKSLAEDILLFEAEGNYIKVAKRMYALAKQIGDHHTLEKLTKILNSPLGKVYMLTAYLEILQEFPEAVTPRKVKLELDTLKDYFAKLYYPELKGLVPSISVLPKLEKTLQAKTKDYLKLENLLPIHKLYQI